MPTKKYFSTCPAFPDDVPTAQLPSISLAKLASQDEDESRQLFHACTALGFFLLDFQGTPEGEAFVEEAEKIFELNEEVHALDYEEKMKHPFKPPDDFFGHPPPPLLAHFSRIAGRNKKAVKSNQRLQLQMRGLRKSRIRCSRSL